MGIQRERHDIIKKENHETSNRQSPLAMMIIDAANGFQVSERGKEDLVRNHLLQFSEILKINLRKRIYQSRFQAQKLWNTLIDNGGTVFVTQNLNILEFENSQTGGAQTNAPIPNSSTANQGASALLGQISNAAAFFIPQNTVGRIMIAGVAALSFSSVYRALIRDWKTLVIIFALKTGYDKASQKVLAMELDTHLNFLHAFEEHAQDELENERVVKDIAEQLAMRFINHASILSKNGQRVFADVIVTRIFKHLSRHAQGYENESLVWYESELQHLVWYCQDLWQKMVLPVDRVKSRKPLNLMDRCIRALSTEISESDSRVLEFQPFHKFAESGVVWTASDVLAKSGVFVALEREYFGHSQTNIESFGYVYGTPMEVNMRNLAIVHKKSNL